MIEIDSIDVRLNGRHILHQVSLSARPGQLTAIVGPNGSGKSTLLKAMCRDQAYEGNIRLDGRELRSLSPLQAATLRAVLPQASTLPFPFTVREVVAMGVSAGRPGVGAHALASLPEAALSAVDLDGFGGRFYGELSGGEQQRVQLARVLCQVWVPVLDGVPRFLLLDEPVSSLDIKHQLMIMDVARAYANAGGGVIAVLHDLNLTAIYADQILALRDGRVMARGAPEAVLTDDVLARVFDAPLRVGMAPPRPSPFVLPHSALASATQKPFKVAR